MLPVHDSDATTLDKYKAIRGVVKRIPEGFVATYGQVASMAGLPGRARLAGKALGCIINDDEVPWFRVIRSDGRIAFGADTENGVKQKKLLLAEGVVVNGMRINLKKFQWDPTDIW